jgi:hypothetical protein
MQFLPEDVRKVMGKFEVRSSKFETNSKRRRDERVMAVAS